MSNIHSCAYISVFINTLYSIVINSKLAYKYQIRQCFEWYWGMLLTTIEEMLAGNGDADASYPVADPDAT